MKELEFLDALGGMNEKYILEAAESGISTGKRVLRRGVLAACLCLAVLAVYLGGTEVFRWGKPVHYANASSSSLASAPAGTENTEPAPSPAVTVGTESAPEGVYIPAVELPEGDAAAACMVPLVVCSGGVYVEAGSWRGEEARALDALTGEYLGNALGTLDPWSGEEAWEQEFAGTVSGPIHAVKGYGTDFRICLRQEYVDENGETQLRIQYLERLNGVTLTTGADLFEDRLHLRGRVTEIRWQDHDDWNYDRGNLRDAALDGETWDAFLEALDRGGFVDLRDPERKPSLFDSPRQTHLCLRLEDGSSVQLRLFAEGYVWYTGLGHHFVNMPGPEFDAVYAACGGK